MHHAMVKNRHEQIDDESMYYTDDIGGVQMFHNGIGAP